MKHLLKCIESAQYEYVYDEMLLRNLKRKIEEDPKEVIDDVKKQYNVHYSPTKVKRLSVRSDSTGICLYDDECQQARFVYPTVNNMKPMLIPPIGSQRVVPYDYSRIKLRTMPKLSREALISIFKHLPGWELLPLRLVCKQWAATITGTHSLWNIRISRCPDKWSGLPPFQMYVKHMFLHVANTRVIYDFFVRNPKFFSYICGLLMGHFDLGPLQIKKDEITIKGYTLHRENGLTYNQRWMSMNIFLEAYRQSIIS